MNTHELRTGALRIKEGDAAGTLRPIWIHYVSYALLRMSASIGDADESPEVTQDWRSDLFGMEVTRPRLWTS